MSPFPPGESRNLRAVTFDCWSTLLIEREWSQAYGQRIEALAALAQRTGRPAATEALREAFDAAWNHHLAQWAGGVSTTTADLADHTLARLDFEVAPQQRAALVRQWEDASHEGQVEAVDGAVETLRELAESGLRLGLVCDTGLTPGRVVREHLASTGLLPHLEICIFSDEVGVPKPHPRPFRAALGALRAEAGEALHVGDLRRTDIAGARSVGMGSIRLSAIYDDPSSLPEADAVADSHTVLRELLAKRR